MGEIDRTTAKGQIVALPFVQDALAASQTDAQLVVQDGLVAVEGISAPWPGEVVGYSYDLSAAATAGSLTIGPSVEGTERTAQAVTVTTGTKGYKRIPRGKIPFLAGQQLGVEITTDGSWDGINSDLVVVVYVLYQLMGI